MTQPDVEEFVTQRNRKFRWAAFLPKRKAWIQTLILLPFGLPVANFLAASWLFSANAILEERQYLIGVLSMAINLFLPSLFFAFLFHWGWAIWKETGLSWYPRMQSLGAGYYATMTIAFSFGMVALFTHNLGVCATPGWGPIGQTLLCNLDGYGFESKSWFGAWFIIAAYCYQAQSSITAIYDKLLHHRHYSSRVERAEFGAVATAEGELSPPEDFRVNSIDPINTDNQE